jgi:hypothetical protein
MAEISTKYVWIDESPQIIELIIKAGVKLDPEVIVPPYPRFRAKVPEWVPAAIKMWRDNNMYGGMELETFLRKLNKPR